MSAVVLAINVVPALSQKIPEPGLGPNLVKNAGFEEGALHWQISADSAVVVSDIAHSGNHSLFYDNPSASRYKLFFQNVQVQPGQHLQFSVWVKGEGVGGSGAGLYMQSYAGVNFMGGSYPGGIKGTFDWKQVTGEYTVLPNTTGSSVGLFLKKGATGKVWFDDVEVRIVTPPPFISSLLYPNYRGIVQQGDTSPWKYQVQINAAADWKKNPLKIITTLTNAEQKVLLKQQHSVASTEQQVLLSMKAPQGLAKGNYVLTQNIIDPNGETYRVNQQRIQVVSAMPKVYIDQDGFTVVDGKRFFPMGLYLHAPQTSDDNLARISEGGFNTVLSYNSQDPNAYLARAAKHDLKVVYNSGKSTKYVDLLRNKPALLAWYTSDEPDTGDLPALRAAYQKIQQADFNHPTFLVQDKAGMMPKHFDNTDILGADPYPVGSANLTKTSRNTRLAVDAVRGAKGVWIVPQLMDWHVYRPDSKVHPPSLDELRNQAYQAIINGAKGLIWYSYYDLMYTKSRPRDKSTEDMDIFNRRWKDAVKMTAEINQIVPVVLANKKVPLESPQDASIEVGAWKDENQLLLLLANPYYEEKSITLTLPAGWRIATTNQGEIKSTFINRQATFTLPSVASGVFRLERM